MDVDALLAENKSKHKSTEVKKDVELQFDLGNLLATDLNIIDTAAFRCVCVWCVCGVCVCTLCIMCIRTKPTVQVPKSHDTIHY